MAPGACPVNLPLRSPDLQLPSRHRVSHPTTTHPHQDRGGTPALHPHNHWFLGCCSNKDTPGQSRLPICILHREFCWPSPMLCMHAVELDRRKKQTNKKHIVDERWEQLLTLFFILFYYLSLLFLSICTISSNEPGFSLTILQLDSAVSQEKNCFHLKKLFLYNSYCSNIV